MYYSSVQSSAPFELMSEAGLFSEVLLRNLICRYVTYFTQSPPQPSSIKDGVRCQKPTRLSRFRAC